MAEKRGPKIRTVTQTVSLQQLLSELLVEGKVRVEGFGIFGLKKMRPRHNAFNPGSAKFQYFPGYTKITFIPNKLLKAEIKSWRKK